MLSCLSARLHVQLHKRFSHYNNSRSLLLFPLLSK